MLFSNLLEARAFRRASTLEKYSVNELGKILFLHLLALCILNNEEGNAKTYAKETLNYPLFDGIRFSSTDLCNLISAYKHSDRYLQEKSRVLPILQLKRFLRTLTHDTQNKQDRNDARALFYKLQTILGLKDPLMNKLRREIVDSDGDNYTAAQMLYNQLLKTTYNSDLIGKLHAYLEKLDA